MQYPAFRSRLPSKLPPNTQESGVSKNNQSQLVVKNLRVAFTLNNGWFKPKLTLKAVDGISFSINPGETLGIVGESGSGKSTLARAILQLVSTTSGSVNWNDTDLTTLSAKALNSIRRDLQIVFQDPLASLNPARTIGESIAEPLTVFESHLTRAQRQRKVLAMLEHVGLDNNMINRYPHELSGGQNQRVGIARAMILQPKVLICDEAVSALDVSIQAQIIQLLKTLQVDFGLSLIFISHDLSVVWEISRRIMVMYRGAVVELATREALFSRPQHPYTQQLISAVPTADPHYEKKRVRLKLKGELTSPLDTQGVFRFLPSKISEGNHYLPKLEERFSGHFVAEHDSIDKLLSDN